MNRHPRKMGCQNASGIAVDLVLEQWQKSFLEAQLETTDPAEKTRITNHAFPSRWSESIEVLLAVASRQLPDSRKIV